MKVPQTVDDDGDDDDDDDDGGGGDWSSKHIAANETQPSASVLMGILQKFTACRKEEPKEKANRKHRATICSDQGLVVSF